jgi:hypothetical protein
MEFDAAILGGPEKPRHEFFRGRIFIQWFMIG